ncbi:DUF2141 domain-containing protein [Constantimarinum furrinae]|uniref:DUF2141 domain-containing protein n=1 Tax=Constantimarinum furrinae TaxID=2562285 RepID=A0A7G8PVT8_9FLAO|nr:DUF2141 domain-containing protein [Constantimarinum furrinae]QNJ98454.1 hypothetical protein ALE3EI_1907 [Constantimarinum furrinae]
MQTVLFYLSLLFATITLSAQNTIVVDMQNFESNNGTVRVGLYDEEANFLEKEIKSLSSAISGKKATVTFSGIPDGVYAISCYHDEDNNGELKMFFGMFPLEDYGTSNNAPARFGPPKWSDAKFEVKGGETKKFTIYL